MVARSERLGRLGRMDRYWWFVLPLLALTVALYVVPLGKILVLSFSDPQPGVDNYVTLATSDGIRRMWLQTLKICLWTTVVAVLLGYVVAYVMAHAGRRHQQLILVFVLMPFWISVLVRAFSWLILLRNNGLVNETLLGVGLIDEPLALARNELGVLIGMVHYMIPFAVLPLYSSMQSIDRRLVPAARSLGAGSWHAFRTVYLPMTVPGISGALLLVFVFSFGFYVTPAILGGGRVVMVSEYVSVAVLQTVRWGLAAAISSVLLVSTLLLVVGMTRVFRARVTGGV